ncbi:hypothetical protein A2824_03615 [Candidatus Nomurabacteria bacterium RIFCSPHIGHO2_01_FULL_42_16]|uniref:Type II secretion system protein GspI C-terminal domain-containing protein n=1 Tax=Candidatus Nomurabacteria bacterium RIFCSPHIGHO2_01_FULL_42_16 TaxID=1801743 RepID=A0A1F6VK60_9BACT|nr:MAG: hypothetical protein A2824_03615 [Candidatus Nomurabacteria bacterium RIFCSPHIGHO2_01_FULL_42_16]
MKNFKLKNNRACPAKLQRSGGFTLIETLTALLIFSTSIVVLITATSQGFSNTNYAKNKFIASYLAQEGVEIVRNARDSFGWDNTEINNAASSLFCQNPNCLVAGEPSAFSRSVSLLPDNITNSTEVKITSTVTWDQGITQKHVEYVEYLYNWQ